MRVPPVLVSSETRDIFRRRSEELAIADRFQEARVKNSENIEIWHDGLYPGGHLSMTD
jgi:hypothetical protein